MERDFLFGLAGGVLMGGACSVLMILNGRILGVSGVLGGALSREPDAGWRRAFIAGMLVIGAFLARTQPSLFVADAPRSVAAALVGGLLVGAGTQLGSGCTSGHGVCGVGRFSRRSIVATLVFMGVGAGAVLAIRAATGGAL